MPRKAMPRSIEGQLFRCGLCAEVGAAVGGELRVEGGGEQMALAHEDREAVALGEHRDIFADLLDARRANVDGFEWAGVECRAEPCGRLFNGAVDLAAVGVALDGG